MNRERHSQKPERGCVNRKQFVQMGTKKVMRGCTRTISRLQVEKEGIAKIVSSKLHMCIQESEEPHRVR